MYGGMAGCFIDIPFLGRKASWNNHYNLCNVDFGSASLISVRKADARLAEEISKGDWTECLALET